MLQSFKYEMILWLMFFLKNVPGHLGITLRNLIIPYRQGKNVKVWDSVQIDYPAKLVIGDYSSINRGTIINCGGGVKIGKNVLIAPNVIIYSQNHNYKDKTIHIKDQGYIYKETIIEDDVWIAAGCIILPGVRVGKGSVIGAGSVVTKDVGEYRIVVGNPAKSIGVRDEQ